MNIVFSNVTKRFGEKPALEKIDIRLSDGITAIIGENGSGKTTFIKIVMCLLSPDSGTVEVSGRPLTDADAAEWVEKTAGFCPAGDFLFEKMSGRGNLEHVSRVKTGHRDAYRKLDKIIADFGVAGELDDLYEVYSTGMRKKLQLVSSLIGKPGLLVWDEPFSGLDEKSSRLLAKLMRQTASKGVLLLYTCRNIAQAEKIANRALVLQKGRIAADLCLPSRSSELNRYFAE